MPLGVLEQRLMRDLRTPANVADVDRAVQIERSRREAKNVGRVGQIGAGSPGLTRHSLDAVVEPEKYVIEVRQEFDQIPREFFGPCLDNETCRLAASLAPVGERLERIQFVGVTEDRKKEVEVPIEDGLGLRQWGD